MSVTQWQSGSKQKVSRQEREEFSTIDNMPDWAVGKSKETEKVTRNQPWICNACCRGRSRGMKETLQPTDTLTLQTLNRTGTDELDWFSKFCDFFKTMPGLETWILKMLAHLKTFTFEYTAIIGSGQVCWSHHAVGSLFWHLGNVKQGTTIKAPLMAFFLTLFDIGFSVSVTYCTWRK